MGFGQDIIRCVCFLWIWIWSPGSVSLLGFRSFPIFLSLLSIDIWDLEDFRAFICFLFSSALSNWFVHFVWNALGQRGSVGMGFGPMPFVAYGGLQPRTAPIGLACPHAEE